MTTGERIVKEAYTWLGTPHVNMGKVKGVGVDCGMLLICVLEGAGLVPRDSIKVKPYSNMWYLSHSNGWFVSTVEKYCDRVPADNMAPGAFLLYKYGRCVSHGAIYVGGGELIHAWVEHGVVMGYLDDACLKDKAGRSRLYGVYRFNPGKAGEVINGTV
nr:MAG TPA: cell wall peptidase [Bacteriophage sp.]